MCCLSSWRELLNEQELSRAFYTYFLSRLTFYLRLKDNIMCNNSGSICSITCVVAHSQPQEPPYESPAVVNVAFAIMLSGWCGSEGQTFHFSPSNVQCMQQLEHHHWLHVDKVTYYKTHTRVEKPWRSPWPLYYTFITLLTTKLIHLYVLKLLK